MKRKSTHVFLFFSLLFSSVLRIQFGGASAWADEPIVSQQVTLRPDTDTLGDNIRYGFEFSVIARGNEVVSVWMKRPSDSPQGFTHIRTLLIAYSDDAGTTWTFEEMDAPNSGHGQPEADPFTALSPLDNRIYVGGMGGNRSFFISTLLATGGGFSAPIEIWDDPIPGQQNPPSADKPWIAAGPVPGGGASERIYLAAEDIPIIDGSGQHVSRQLMWSDDNGQTWSDPDFSTGIFRFPLPRIGTGGELYISGTTSTDVRLSRSIDLDNTGTPIFKDASVIANFLSVFPQIPSEINVIRYCALAVDPDDGRRVFVVWTDKTGMTDPQGNQNVDLYFSRTNDATADTVTWTRPAIIPSDGLTRDEFFPWLEMDTFGRLHLLWMDSRNGTELDNDDTHGTFDIFYAYSEDEGASWTEFRLTPDSFDVAGHLTGPLASFFGDYNGMAVSGKRIYCFYPDPSPGYPEAHYNIIVFGDPITGDSVTAIQGEITGGNLASLSASDDNRFALEAANTTPETTEVEVIFTIASADELDVQIETRSSEPDTDGEVLLKNWGSGQFESVHTYTAGTSDAELWVRALEATDHVRDSDGRVELRLTQSKSITSATLQPSYDLVRVIAVTDN